MLARDPRPNPSEGPLVNIDVGAWPTSKFDVEAFINASFINVRSTSDAIRKIDAAIQSGAGFLFFTLNLDHLCKLQILPSFRWLYNKADFVSADGWPVAWLARRPGELVLRVAGADLVFPVCELAAEKGFPVFLFGTTEDVLHKASTRLEGRYPGLIVAGVLAPPPQFDPRSAIASDAAQVIHRSGARICLVALGAPRQETFSEYAQAICPSVGFLCIGAALDFIAGAQRRAPLPLRVLGLEWAWRWLSSPRRLSVRYLQSIRILSDILLQRVGKRLRGK